MSGGFQFESLFVLISNACCGKQKKQKQKNRYAQRIFFLYEGVMKWMFYVPPVAILLVKIKKNFSNNMYKNMLLENHHTWNPSREKKYTKKENKFMYFLHSFFFI